MASLFSFVALIGPLSPEHQVCRGAGASNEDPGGTPCLSDLWGSDKPRELVRQLRPIDLSERLLVFEIRQEGGLRWSRHRKR